MIDQVSGPRAKVAPYEAKNSILASLHAPRLPPFDRRRIPPAPPYVLRDVSIRIPSFSLICRTFTILSTQGVQERFPKSSARSPKERNGFLAKRRTLQPDDGAMAPDAKGENLGLTRGAPASTCDCLSLAFVGIVDSSLIDRGGIQ